mgnify:CR=1 FL=1
MCGIYCYVGKKKAIPIILEGLKTLEYRGYDSAGIAYVYNNEINIKKKQGKLDNLKQTINNDIDTKLGIGHTRWATHGVPSENNAHPFKQGKITLVHNGIVENYLELKYQLKEYNLTSETDTEILACLIDKLYQEKNDMIKVLSKLKKLVKGSYALGIINDDDKNSLYAIRKDSPLILAKSDIGNFIASDIPAILKYTNKYILLDNDEIACLNKNDIIIYDTKLNIINKEIKTFEGNLEMACKNGYDHFMLKEIYEQPDIINNTFLPLFEFNKEELKEKYIDLKKYNKIQIIGCGSAYHVGLIGKNIIEKYCNIPVEVEIASEYRYKKVFFDDKTLAIFISQSGETADTLACLRKVNENNIDSLSIINVIGSSIARESKKVIYTKAGCEIAVATTKAYSAQLATLILITLINMENEINLIDVKDLPKLMTEILNCNFKQIAEFLYKNKNIFFIGRGIDYSLCEEGALKLKEISYIHCQAYAAGELKHGTISLIEKDTPVIAISTDKTLNEKTISNIKEIKARGAKVIYIITKELDMEGDFYNKKIVIPNTSELLQPLLTILPLQLIAYYVAKLNNCDIDKPRNLAKSVTVE